jgi:hypothetical protein
MTVSLELADAPGAATTEVPANAPATTAAAAASLAFLRQTLRARRPFAPVAGLVTRIWLSPPLCTL